MGWVVSATSWMLYPRQRPSAHCIGGWVGPRASLYRCRKSLMSTNSSCHTVHRHRSFTLSACHSYRLHLLILLVSTQQNSWTFHFHPCHCLFRQLSCSLQADSSVQHTTWVTPASSKQIKRFFFFKLVVPCIVIQFFNKKPTDATLCRYLFTAKLLYMFRVSQHPSSGVLKTVPAASGTGHTTCTATPLLRGLTT